MAKTKITGKIKTSNVVTKKELEKEKGDSKKSPASSPEKKEESKVENPVYQFECTFAQGGKSRVSFNHVYLKKEYSYKIELDNRVYTLPEFLGSQDINRYRKALTANGFVEITKSIKPPKIPEKKTGKYIYKAIHPEHNSKNRMNCSLGLVMVDDEGNSLFDKDGKQVTEKVEVENGMVQTSIKGIYQALIKAGFLDAGKTEVE